MKIFFHKTSSSAFEVVVLDKDLIHSTSSIYIKRLLRNNVYSSFRVNSVVHAHQILSSAFKYTSTWGNTVHSWLKGQKNPLYREKKSLNQQSYLVKKQLSKLFKRILKKRSHKTKITCRYLHHHLINIQNFTPPCRQAQWTDRQQQLST